MNRIAEQKAMEAYPIKKEWVGNQYGGMEDTNSFSREKYQEGYDQALIDIEKQVEESIIEKSNGEVTIEDLVAYNKGFKTGRELALQDFLEKAEKWIEKHIEMFSLVHLDSDGNEEWRNDFKNYMQNE